VAAVADGSPPEDPGETQLGQQKPYEVHRMVSLGRDLKDHLVPTPPAISRDIFH